MPKRVLIVVAILLALLPPGPAFGSPEARQAVVVVLRDGADAHRVAAAHGRAYDATVNHVYGHALRGYSATVPRSRLAWIAADPRVAYVVSDVEFRAAADPAQVLPRAVDRIEADASSTIAGDGSGDVPVNVAVIDSGVLLTHPDLTVVGGANCSTGDGFGPAEGHGTLVAGDLAALDNGIGAVGVAPGARIWSVRVLKKNGKGTLSDVLCGVDWVAGTRADADSANDIAVANMSLVGPGSDDGNCGRTKKDALHTAICGASAAGVTIVVAAGNDSHDLAGAAPASYDEVLAVTAIVDSDGRPGGLGGPDPCYGLGPDDSPADFSNFAADPADEAHVVAAPGVCSLTTTVLGGYGEFFLGTSMASPYVAGVVALCVHSGACAGMMPSQIVAKIVADARAYSLDHPGYGFTGDPQHPIAGRYYGPLVYAGSY
jgi:subtilisin family serine protease